MWSNTTENHPGHALCSMPYDVAGRSITRLFVGIGKPRSRTDTSIHSARPAPQTEPPSVGAFWNGRASTGTSMPSVVPLSSALSICTLPPWLSATLRT